MNERQELPYGFQINAITDENYNFVKNSQGEDILRYSFYLEPLKIRAITFKGGGARGFAYQKFIQIIEDNGTLKDVKEVGGSSAGAIAAIFTAMHFPSDKRAATLDQFDTANALDLMGNSLAWKIYRVFTSPLYIISKPFSWLSQGIDWLGSLFDKIPIIGKIPSIVLKITAGISQIPTILSPEGIAGIINLCAGGGWYRGDKIQRKIKFAIQQNTKNGIEDILKKINSPEKRRQFIQKLINIGLLYRNAQNKLKLTSEITFNHFYHLSQLPGSQFKELYITGTAIQSGNTVIFNRLNSPDKPIYQAVRISMSIPYVYKNDGKYMDGGCADNFPIRHASKKKYDPFQEQFIDDRSARLGVRVDYHHELNHLWHKARSSWLAKKLNGIFRWISTKFLGMDTYAADDEVTEVMNKDYAQRTVALYDHGIGLTEFDLTKEKRHELNESTENAVNAYFMHHREEKASMETYVQPTEKPLWERFQRLTLLQNPAIPSIQLYPSLDAKLADQKRSEELSRLEQESANLEKFSKLPLTKRHHDFKEKAITLHNLRVKIAQQRKEIKELYNTPIVESQSTTSSDIRLLLNDTPDIKFPENNRLITQFKHAVLESEVLELRLKLAKRQIQNLKPQKDLLDSKIQAAEIALKTNQDKIQELEGDAPQNTMPLWMQASLLSHLENKKIPTEEIFFIPGKSDEELATLREKEIKRFKQAPGIQLWNQATEILKSYPYQEQKHPDKNEQLNRFQLQNKAIAKFNSFSERERGKKSAQADRTIVAIQQLENSQPRLKKLFPLWKKQEALIKDYEQPQEHKTNKPRIKGKRRKRAYRYQWHDRM